VARLDASDVLRRLPDGTASGGTTRLSDVSIHAIR
jgi:hypothetical protein